MVKRGKTPSLIGGAAGACKFVTTKKKRSCKRCDGDILGGTECVEVNVPASMGHKCYCMKCFEKILNQTQCDLDNLKGQLQQLRTPTGNP
jgi:hypothetical protein